MFLPPLVWFNCIAIPRYTQIVLYLKRIILGNKYTCENILQTLKEINFADIKEQGFIPLYKRNELTDAFHRVCGFNTDDEFITKQKMKTIQKISKCR